MLKPAIEYASELKILFNRASLEIENQYYFSEPGSYMYEPSDNTIWRKDYVSLDSDGEIVGWLTYSIDFHALSAYKWGLISFKKKGNLILIKDLEQAIVDVFEKYNLNRISFSCYADNPAINGYFNLIKRLGGTKTGYEHEVARLLDGKLHDFVDFEIMKVDYFKSDYYLKRRRKYYE